MTRAQALRLLVQRIQPYAPLLSPGWMGWFAHPSKDFAVDAELERLGAKLDWYDGSQATFFNRIHQSTRALREPDYPLESLLSLLEELPGVTAHPLRSRSIRASPLFKMSGPRDRRLCRSSCARRPGSPVRRESVPA